MGALLYDGLTVEFDDRVLAHLQIVIVTKFRAGESFLMSWVNPLSSGSGRTAIWLTPTSPVRFKFSGSRVPTIDRKWIEALHKSASSGPGLIVCDPEGHMVQPVK
ncbi:DUF7882 family protein [Herbiconiux sp. SYSU D00978]|uniref:DUF7882 family protein n=1 Tax=Herbiconiux sp. SYSU D00978 TaxID=2812562 RepID=UPI001A95C93F|nr:ATP-dependent DNA ligase [Herbiconiux sp. SYSU D00978]